MDAELGRLSNIASQVTSRTRIRQEFERYNSSEISRQELIEFTVPKLSDAMHSISDLLGITRLSPQMQPVIEVGAPIPQRPLARAHFEVQYRHRHTRRRHDCHIGPDPQPFLAAGRRRPRDVSGPPPAGHRERVLRPHRCRGLGPGGKPARGPRRPLLRFRAHRTATQRRGSQERVRRADAAGRRRRPACTGYIRAERSVSDTPGDRRIRLGVHLPCRFFGVLCPCADAGRICRTQCTDADAARHRADRSGGAAAGEKDLDRDPQSAAVTETQRGTAGCR